MRISDWSSDVCSSDLIYNEAPTRDDFIGALSAPDAAPDLRTKGTTRGLSLRSAPETAPAAPTVPAATRSEERRVGQEWVSTGKSRWLQYPSNKKDRKAHPDSQLQHSVS